MANSKYLFQFPGLEYLALVSVKYRAQVAEWCKMSPTLGHLRQVMLQYGELSDDVSRIAMTGSHSLVYTDVPSRIWSDFWYFVLLEPPEDTSEYRVQLERRLGHPSLATSNWNCTSVSSSVTTVDSVVSSGSLDEPSSFTLVPDLGLDLTNIRFSIVLDLSIDLKSLLKCSDSKSTGRGITHSPSPYFDLASLTMDKFHLWSKVGMDSLDTFSDHDGFCYLKLFVSGIRNDLSLCLGNYPNSKLVAAIYLAGLVFGFSELNSLNLTVIEPTGIGDSNLLHIGVGSLSYADVFKILASCDLSVGAMGNCVKFLFPVSFPAFEVTELVLGTNEVMQDSLIPSSFSVMIPSGQDLSVLKLPFDALVKYKGVELNDDFGTLLLIVKPGSSLTFTLKHSRSICTVHLSVLKFILTLEVSSVFVHDESSVVVYKSPKLYASSLVVTCTQLHDTFDYNRGVNRHRYTVVVPSCSNGTVSIPSITPLILTNFRVENQSSDLKLTVGPLSIVSSIAAVAVVPNSVCGHVHLNVASVATRSLTFTIHCSDLYNDYSYSGGGFSDDEYPVDKV